MLKPILAVAALLAASPALAAGTATLQSATPNGVQSMTIAWQDHDTARIDLPRGGSYTLVRDGEPYTVNQMDGQTMVLSLKGIVPHVGLGFGPASDRYQAASVDSLRATGATETVAGIAGEEYEMAWTDANGSAHLDRVILSDDPLVVEMTDAFLIFPRALGQPEDPRTVALRARGLGVLRKGDEFHVTAISGDAPPADRFTLPAPPMSMDQMMKGMVPGRGQ